MPYMNASSWGWGTIPAVSIMAYLLLEIDGAATECEIPFRKNRPNHLDMDAYCLLAMNNIQQLVLHSVDMHLRDNGYRADEDDANGSDLPCKPAVIDTVA